MARKRSKKMDPITMLVVTAFLGVLGFAIKALYDGVYRHIDRLYEMHDKADQMRREDQYHVQGRFDAYERSDRNQDRRINTLEVRSKRGSR